MGLGVASARRRRACVWVALGLAIGVIFASEPAQAQREEARAAFERGQTAADEGRWADALREFEQAYMLSGVPTALFNAGMAQRALGRHRDARDTFVRLLDSHPDSTAAEQARALRDEEAARVAVLELAGLDPSAAYEIRVDGRRLETDIEAVTAIELDPGQHGLVTEREGYEPFTWEGSLSDGDRKRLQVVMAERARTEEGRSIARSPLLWIIVAVVAGAGAAGLGIWAKRNAQLDPAYDNVFVFP